MSEDEILAIFSSLFSFAVFGFIIFGIIKSVRKGMTNQFGGLLKLFRATGSLPLGLTSIYRVSTSGKGVYNNVLKMTEQDRTLYVKLPFGGLGLAIPYSAFSSVSVKDSGKNFKIVSIRFADGQVVPITMWLRKDQWSQFPELIKMGEAGISHRPVTSTAPKPQITHPAKTILETIQEHQQGAGQTGARLDLESYKEKTFNLVRAVIFVGAILILAGVIFGFYVNL